MPPWPFSPLKFSGLIERVFADDSRERLPRLIPRPLKRAMRSVLLQNRDWRFRPNYTRDCKLQIANSEITLSRCFSLRQQGTFLFVWLVFRPYGRKTSHKL